MADEGKKTAMTASRLSCWCLATGHTAAIVSLPVLALHAVGALGDLLGGVGTVVGLTLYLLLWGTTWATNRRYLDAADFDDTTQTVAAGLKWGAVTGLVFGYGLVAVVGLRTGEVGLAAVLLVAGSLVGPLVGAFVGGVFALVDRFLVWITRQAVPPADTTWT